MDKSTLAGRNRTASPGKAKQSKADVTASPEKKVINLKSLKTREKKQRLDFEIFAPEKLSSSSKSSVKSDASGNIQAQWKKQEKIQKEKAFMMQQGVGGNKTISAHKPKPPKPADLPSGGPNANAMTGVGTFAFDPVVSADQRFIEFKAIMFSRGLKARKDQAIEDDGEGESKKTKKKEDGFDFSKSKDTSQMKEDSKNSNQDGFLRA